jgi:hypothetical protein
MERRVKIEIKELTTCGVDANGKAIDLNFIDGEGRQVCLRMPFDGGQAIAMTLPRLLSEALRKITGTDKTRYAFPLVSWYIEAADEKDTLIATLATEDGFAASFAIPHDACSGLAWALRHEAKCSLSEDDVNSLAAIPGNGRLN